MNTLTEELIPILWKYDQSTRYQAIKDLEGKSHYKSQRKMRDLQRNITFEYPPLRWKKKQKYEILHRERCRALT